MAKTKSTYNKKRSMRRSTIKAGMFGFSSAPKSFHDLAKIKLKEKGMNVNDATVVGQMAYALLGDSMLRPKEYDAKYPGWQKWDKNIPKMSGGKRRRSNKSTRKRGKKAGFKIGNMDFGDVRGNLGKVAAQTGMVDENVFTKDRGMATGAKIYGDVAYDMLHAKKLGGKRRRSKRSTKKAGNSIGELTEAWLDNRGDDLKKMFGSKEGGKRRRSKKTNKKRSRKH